MSTTSFIGAPDRAGLWRQAAVQAVALSCLFLVVYGGTSWITSLRTNVGTWFYPWERLIPFVPLMIIPYMSIDLFFVAAPFLCSDRRELQLFSRRITLAIVVAGACFLTYPLKLAVERPTVTGWYAPLWNWFRTADRPYNLLPSLHIALRTFLADLYSRHTRGLLRLASIVWFSLIGLSTLLTYQHHVVDVIGGFILATGCFYLIRDEPLRLPMVRNSRIGWKYFALGGGLAALAAATWPWGAILIWPIVSVAIISTGYFFLGPAVFRKQDGRLLLSARIVMGPVLWGQHLSLLYYKRQCRAWDAIAPGVWIGRRLNSAEAADAVRQGVTAVLDLSVGFHEAQPFLEIAYRHLPVLDLTAPTQIQLAEAVEFVDQHSASGIVYVHCKIGYSRSVAVVGAWLISTGRAATADEAVAQLREVRPSIVVRPEVMNALREFERLRPGRCPA